MKFDGDIRVHTDRRYSDLYNDLKSVAFGEMHEVFFLCVCLGYRAKKTRELGKSRDQRFWSKTITPDEYACFYAMAMEENAMDFASVRDDKQVLARMEEYANAGMEIFMADFLGDYLLAKGDIPRLDPSASKEIAKDLLHFINDRL